MGYFFFQVKCTKLFQKSQHFCNCWLILVWSLKPMDIDNMHITKKNVLGFFPGFKNTSDSNTKWQVCFFNTTKFAHAIQPSLVYLLIT